MAPTVLYVGGSGRSGSTLLGRLLGEVDGVWFGGEIRYLWERGVLEGRVCGCGRHVTACRVWSEVLGRLGAHEATARRAVEAQHRLGHVRQLPWLAAGDDRLRRRVGGWWPELLERLYVQIADATGADVIVDTSKSPLYAAVLDRLTPLDVRMVHLVRDARASAYSWSRTKALGDGGERTHMQRFGATKAATLWTVWNRLAAALWRGAEPSRYRLVRYEDLMSDPAATMRGILAMVDRGDLELPVTGDGRVVMHHHHAVAGNPDRMRSGAVALREDAQWRDELTAGDRRRVEVVAGSTMRRFGY